MSDLRKAAEAVLERWDSPAWEWMKQGPTAELMAALRARLAAPRPEPAFWRYKGNPPIWDRHKGEWLDHFYFTDDKALAMLKDNNPLPLYAAPPTAAPEPEKRHPGYILGNHWLETAYSRVCAGEAEADVLRDCGWERVTDAEALRRDAELGRWIREETPPIEEIAARVDAMEDKT